MANEFYKQGQERARSVQSLFSRIASRYDLINDLQSFGMHRFWKREMVRISGAGKGKRALDVCCGTGDMAFRMAAAGADATGLDFTEEMLKVAELRKGSCRLAGRVEFVHGDAMALPFEESTFDVVTVGFGLRNLADWKLGLREMWRVARPGGTVTVLDFGKPDNAAWRAMYFGYLRFFVPMLGLMAAGSASAYAYILESLKHYPAQRGVAEAMKSFGMRDARIRSFMGGAMTINSGVK